MRQRAVPTLVLLLLCLAGVPAFASDLALKRVMLSTGGVAYLEYEAEVEGDAKLTLNVPLDQVDDILKSIVVYDSKGGVGAASLPGRQPLAQLFNDLPFGPEALASPAALLNALQGAEIRVGASHPITGKLLKALAETARASDGTTTSRNRVSVLTAEGLQQFILEDAESVRFVDADLQAKVDQALAEIASHRAKDRRAITLTTRGTGTRTLRVGYVVAAPLWKASFRLNLSVEGAAHLQGWAVLENMSGEDWTGVELTLLSGNPVSFHQAIYQAYYVNRPEVPVEVAGRILPKLDMGAVDQVRVASAAMGGPIPMPQAAAAAPSAALMQRMKALGLASDLAAENAPLQAATVDTAEAQEGMTQVSFRIPVPVTLESGQTALVPLVDRDVPAERLALLQLSTSTTHPLAAVKLTNDGASGLPPGVVTLYEQTAQGTAYIGDARLAGLPAGESRLLSYALDEKTKILRDTDATSTLTKATISQGVLHLTRADRQTVLYTLAAPKTEARRVIVEQPMIANWALVEPAGKTVEETATAYRVAVDLKPGETRILRFTLEHPREDTLRILDTDDEDLGAVAKDRALDPGVRVALAELARLRRVVSDKKAAAERIESAIGGIAEDQSRIRANLESIDKESALHKRYIEKLADEETRIEALQAERSRVADETRAARTAVEAYIAKLGV
ncbi:MAG TPA: DUF4139 domain-containing protein [Stellaceae bacterium]|nr:DUF4139 domain-containing protein [Stellaceae bacterium]